MIHENLAEFEGLAVADWSEDAGPRIDLRRNAVRLRLDYEEAEEGVTLAQKLAGLLEAPGAAQLTSLVIGSWQPTDSGTDSSEVVEALVAARPKLPGLRNLFIGDIIGEECEISWIRQSNLSPLLAAYTDLEHLTVRGGDNLSFGSPSHDKLKELVIQTGGLPPSVIHEISSARLPALERLELWLGDPSYGGDATVEDLAPLLSAGSTFPKLKYLGLKDSVIADEIAGVIALAPILSQLDVLDLSMGVLGDDGARALLASPAIRKLKKLDLHHHYISDPVAEELKQLGIEVDLSDPQSPDGLEDPEDRFIAVAE